MNFSVFEDETLGVIAPIDDDNGGGFDPPETHDTKSGTASGDNTLPVYNGTPQVIGTGLPYDGYDYGDSDTDVIAPIRTKIPFRVPVFPVNNPTVCNCAWGTATVDADGNCTCKDESSTTTGGVKVPHGTTLPVKTSGVSGTDKTGKAATPTTTGNTPADKGGTSEPNTIFGFSPLVVIGAAVAGIWLLSSMEGEKK